jgi:hypothetical protein
MNWKGRGRRRSWPNLGYCLWHMLEEPKETQIKVTNASTDTRTVFSWKQVKAPPLYWTCRPFPVLLQEYLHTFWREKLIVFRQLERSVMPFMLKWACNSLLRNPILILQSKWTLITVYCTSNTNLQRLSLTQIHHEVNLPWFSPSQPAHQTPAVNNSLLVTSVQSYTFPGVYLTTL